MSIYTVIATFKANPPTSESGAGVFLSRLSALEQEQFIAAMYLGREHLHCSVLRTDVGISRSYTDHLDRSEYARIVYEKGENVITYLNRLEACAKASGFDLNTL